MTFFLGEQRVHLEKNCLLQSEDSFVDIGDAPLY